MSPNTNSEFDRHATTSQTVGELVLESAVYRALLDDLAVPASSIHVSVRNGDVLLRGTVTCACEREEAERAAHAVPNVLSVRNELAVWPPDLESELIRETRRELMVDLKRTARGPDHS